ncbi:MAG: ankyrin repeat domain-containing protein [Micavibrio sp.]|nr:MAG: ankyrin repeat domain-containing protein [Micavibrio sp.]
MGYKDYALIEAAADNDEERVLKLLEEEADPNTIGDFGWTALHEACAHGSINPRIIRALLDAEADPNLHTTEGFSCLQLAVQRPDTDIVEMLLDAGADPNHLNGGRANVLYYAAHTGPKMVKTLLDKGADASRLNKDGDSVLHVLVKEGDESKIYNLVVAGADVNVKNAAGESAIDMAKRLAEKDKMYNGSTGISRGLLDRGEKKPHFKPPKRGFF